MFNGVQGSQSLPASAKNEIEWKRNQIPGK